MIRFLHTQDRQAIFGPVAMGDTITPRYSQHVHTVGSSVFTFNAAIYDVSGCTPADLPVVFIPAFFIMGRGADAHWKELLHSREIPREMVSLIRVSPSISDMVVVSRAAADRLRTDRAWATGLRTLILGTDTIINAMESPAGSVDLAAWNCVELAGGPGERELSIRRTLNAPEVARSTLGSLGHYPGRHRTDTPANTLRDF